MIKEFEDIRRWGEIRGLKGSEFQQQYQRFLQEAVEIHEAHTNNDHDEIVDAIGDTIVTLVNLSVTIGVPAEDCLAKAFDVINRRKGLTKNGSFIRYGKLPDAEKVVCDLQQGNPGNQEFKPGAELFLKPEHFTLQEIENNDTN